jgi:hypothetical protein
MLTMRRRERKLYPARALTQPVAVDVRGDHNSDHVMCAAGISDGCRILYHVTVCLLQGRSRPSQADIIPLHTGTR